jgi:uncharacterized membrane protein YphA (DoxX/SURF4 family)
MGWPARLIRYFTYSLLVLLALMFAFSGTMKLTGNMDEVRDLLGVAPWFWTFAGLSQAVGATGLVAGLWSARLAVAAALWLAVVMVGAVMTHVLAGDTLADMSIAIALLILLLVTAALRWRDAHLGDLLGDSRRPSGTSPPASSRVATH